jgi:hypothetical protein
MEIKTLRGVYMIFIWYLKIIITFAAQLASGYRPGNLGWAEGGAQASFVCL